MKILFMEDFGKAFIPEKIRPKLRSFLLKAGIDSIPYVFFGGLFYLSIILTLAVYLSYWQYIASLSKIYLWLVSFVSWVVIHLAIAFLLMIVVYVYLDLRIFRRTAKIESVLADFLELFSANLKGGMSLDKALWRAVKPRFGILSNEIRIVAKKVMTGGDVEDALVDFTEKYKSLLVKQSFLLLIEAIKGGGKIADIVDRIVENIRATDNLKKEMSSSAATFTIFISSTVLVISPALFALSFYLLKLLKSFSSNLGKSIMATNITIPLTFSELAVSPENFKFFSIMVLSVVSFFASVIIAIIQKGDIKAGVKYIPIFLGVTLTVYYFFLFALGQVFGRIIL